MGVPKQHIELGGFTFLERVIRTITSQLLPLVPMVFVGAPGDEKGKATVEKIGGKWIENSETHLGPLHSLRLGIKEIPPDIGFLLWPIDHPLASKATVERIMEKSAEFPDSIVIPSFDFKRGHPSRFPAWAQKAVFDAPLEEGAKWILKSFPAKIVHVEVDDPWITANINTPEKLREVIDHFKV